MPITNLSERDGYVRSPRVASLRRVMILVTGLYFCSSLGLWAQRTDAQNNDANGSWTVTSESIADNVNPTRTTESHTQTGNRSLDKQSLQVRGPDGHYEPYQDIEKETVQVDSSTVRTTTRTFARDADGAKTLVQLTDEERRTLPSGDSHAVTTVSHPDANGKLQTVQRKVEETKTISKDVEEMKTTVMLPSVNGGLAPAMKLEERRERGANDTVESQKTTLLPDGAGNWQIGEIRHATTIQEGKTRSTDERVSRLDSEGKLNDISRTVSKESESAPGEKLNSVDTYSIDVPGSTRDGSLHLVERATTIQHTSSTGQQTTEQHVEQPNPGNPHSGLQVVTVTNNTVRPGSSGAKATRTIETRDANGNLKIVTVDTTKSDNIHAIQVQIAPSVNPK